MNSNISTSPLTHHIRSAASRLDPEVKNLVLEMTGRILEHMESHRGDPALVLSEASALIKREMLDRILTPAFILKLFPELSGLTPPELDEWIRNCSYLVRRFAVDLVIPLPSVRPASSPTVWAAGSTIGAACGVLIPWMLDVEPQLRMAIATALSPAGALCGILAIRQLTGKFSILHRLLNIRSHDILDTDQLQVLARDAIRSWLASQIIITLLTGKQISLQKTELDASRKQVPERLLMVLQKLASVPNDLRGTVAEEVIQEFYNEGFQTADIPDTMVWNDLLRERFDVIGVVREGDACRILLAPIIQDGAIRRKGRLTRVR